MKKALKTVVIVIILLFVRSIVGGTDSELLDSTYFEAEIEDKKLELL